jgi:hypothetical protein
MAPLPPVTVHPQENEGWAQLSPSVQVARRSLVVVSEELASGFAVRFQVAVDDTGRVACLHLSVTAGSGREVTQEALRGLPIESWLRAGAAMAIRVFDPDLGWHYPGGDTPTKRRAAILKSLRRKHFKRTGHGRPRLSDEFLRHVADVHAASSATDTSPIRAIQREFEHCWGNERTVHYWVRQARDRGYLPDTRRKRKQ